MPAQSRARLLALALLTVSACSSSDPMPGYIVFFTPYSIVLDAPAQKVVADAAKAAREAPDRAVIVKGYAAPAPETTAQQDMQLSRSRSLAVANALVTRGVLLSRIVQQPKGSQGGDPGIESRRVEIEFGP